jgi:hypothetical protein
MNRLATALIAYAVLGVLSWVTISDTRVRAVPLGILLLFAVKSILRRNDTMHAEQVQADSGEGKDLADSQQLKADG